MAAVQHGRSFKKYRKGALSISHSRNTVCMEKSCRMAKMHNIACKKSSLHVW